MEKLRKYISVILQNGVGLKPGDNIYVKGEPIHWPFIALLAEEAYRAGARYVQVEADHPQLMKARVQYAELDHLSYFPETRRKDLELLVRERWSLIYLDGMEDPDLFDNIDQKRNAIIEKSRRQASIPFFNAIMNGQCAWTIAALPTPKWAAKALQMSPTPAAEKELWNILEPILLLDHRDPNAAWQQLSAILKLRAQRLKQLELTSLHFSGPDTDLTVGLLPQSQWLGGSSISDDGREFLPNIPTYEVFTTPDFRKTEGRVATTRPVQVLGASVEHAWFEFHTGKVVRFDAQRGKAALNSFFEIDERNRYVGEVALVDASSPIYQANKLFHAILFDENAACHLALGRGISSALAQGENMSDDELLAAGCNTALQHIDFMIGSPALSVSATRRNGSKLPIIRDGHFVL